MNSKYSCVSYIGFTILINYKEYIFYPKSFMLKTFNWLSSTSYSGVKPFI